MRHRRDCDAFVWVLLWQIVWLEIALKTSDNKCDK